MDCTSFYTHSQSYYTKQHSAMHACLFLGWFCDDINASHVLSEHVWNHHTSVLLLIVLENGHDGAGYGARGCVELSCGSARRGWVIIRCIHECIHTYACIPCGRIVISCRLIHLCIECLIDDFENQCNLMRLRPRCG